VAGTTTSRSRRILFLLCAVLAPAIVLGLLMLIAVSPIPMRGAELFGGLAKKIKGHPAATAYWTLFAVSMLWIVTGLLAALQELRLRRSNTR
jgi:hypothetical protein